MVVRLCLGLLLSWKKGARRTKADWSGGEFAIVADPQGLRVKIKQSLFEEAQLLEMPPGNRSRSAWQRLSRFASGRTAGRGIRSSSWAAAIRWRC